MDLAVWVAAPPRVGWPRECVWTSREDVTCNLAALRKSPHLNSHAYPSLKISMNMAEFWCRELKRNLIGAT